MFRLLVLCAVLTFVEPFLRHHRCHHPYGRRHCHNHPPFTEDFMKDFKPYKRHCHNHPPFYGYPCPEVAETSEKPNIETQLQTIEKGITQQDEKFHQFCKENSKNATELYGTDSYYIKYDLPEAGKSKVKVQIKHKFIHTTVTKQDGSDENIFEDVKIVPDIANSDTATWSIHNNEVLKITIPYKVSLGTEVATSCGVVNNKVIDVPAVLYPSLGYRQGKKLFIGIS